METFVKFAHGIEMSVVVVHLHYLSHPVAGSNTIIRPNIRAQMTILRTGEKLNGRGTVRVNKFFSMLIMTTAIAKNLGKLAKFCLAFTFLPSPVSMLSFNCESLRIIVRGEVNIEEGGGGNDKQFRKQT